MVAPDERILKIYTDIDRLEKHLLELSPADEKVIRELTGLVRTLSRSEMPIGKPRELMGTVGQFKTIAHHACHDADVWKIRQNHHQIFHGSFYRSISARPP